MQYSTRPRVARSCLERVGARPSPSSRSGIFTRICLRHARARVVDPRSVACRQGRAAPRTSPDPVRARRQDDMIGIDRLCPVAQPGAIAADGARALLRLRGRTAASTAAHAVEEVGRELGDFFVRNQHVC